MARAYQRFGATGQQRPIFGREAEMQVTASGGFGFRLTPWQRLERFLVLGSEHGSYYVGERKLTVENAQAAIECIKEDGLRAVNLAATIHRENRAPKPDAAFFVLALALQHGDLPTRRSAAAQTLPMLRTGSQMLSFAAYLKATGGTNSRIKRRLLANWFNSRRPDQLAFQFIKYQQRNGWSQKDVLRLAHPNPEDAQQPDVQRAMYARIAEKDDPCLADVPPLLQHFDRLRIAVARDPNVTVGATLFGIREGLPREALPTAALADLEVLRALLPTMPPHALLRNLARLARQTLLTEREAIDYVCGRLRELDWLKRGHVHPFAVMLAAFVYSEGRTPEASYRRGRQTEEQPWPVEPRIVGALSSAFEALVNAQPRSDIRVLYALDCSASMQNLAMGTPVRCDKAGAAMILALGKPQPHSQACLFTTYCRQPVPIATSDIAIDDMIIGTLEGTDCAAPILMALDRDRQPYDAIVIFTDNETWYGPEHASPVFQRYKQFRNQQCKLVVCAMAASNANIVDPQDAQQLGIVGLDGNVASLINSFIGAGQLALVGDDGEE